MGGRPSRSRATHAFWPGSGRAWTRFWGSVVGTALRRSLRQRLGGALLVRNKTTAVGNCGGRCNTHHTPRKTVIRRFRPDVNNTEDNLPTPVSFGRPLRRESPFCRGFIQRHERFFGPLSPQPSSAALGVGPHLRRFW